MKDASTNGADDAQPFRRLSGMDLRQALSLAQRHGAVVRSGHDRKSGDGDLLVYPPRGGRPLRVSAHRKDAPRHLTQLLKRLVG